MGTASRWGSEAPGLVTDLRERAAEEVSGLEGGDGSCDGEEVRGRGVMTGGGRWGGGTLAVGEEARGRGGKIQGGWRCRRDAWWRCVVG